MKKKSFVLKVSNDSKYIEFHTADLIVPALPFIVGEDRMSTESNTKNIINHIQQMMEKEGFNHIRCFKNDLNIYHEILWNLKSIPGLDLTYE